MDVRADLRAGHEAFEDGAWLDAFEALGRADEAVPLSGADLELRSACAYLLGRLEAFVELLDRAHQRHLDHGDHERAAYCACWLGLSLAGLGAHAQGSGWFARARRLLPEADGAGVVHGYLQLADALAATATGDLATAFRSGTAAVEMGERFEEADLTALAVQLLGRIELRRSRIDAGFALLDEAMVSVSSGELRPEVAGIVYCSVIDGCRANYSLDRAYEWTEALTRWCEDQPQLVAFTAECHAHRAAMLVFHGVWRQAVAEAERASQGAPRWSARRVAADAQYQRAEVFRLQGAFDAAEEGFEAAGREGAKRQPGLALLRLAQGRVEAARAGLEAELAGHQDPLERAHYLPAYVTAALAGADPDVDGAARAVEELLALRDGRPTPALSAMAEHAAAELRLVGGDAREAAMHARAALEAWLSLTAPYEAARARVLLGRAKRALGDEDGAAMELGVARGTFEALGAAPDLLALRGLDGVTRGPHGLSARELEVLARLAEGETNKTIARHLEISERTVDRHVSNILDKLDVASRTEAASYALRHGLV